MALTHNSKLADTEPSWGTVDKTALPRNAHADEGEAGKKSTWGYPHHWVSGGSKKNNDGIWIDGTMFLHEGGLNAAWAAANGARSGQKAPSGIISHLQTHRKAIGAGDDASEENNFYSHVNRSYSHILDLIAGPAWAITPQMLEKLHDIITAKINGAEPDIAQIEASIGKKLENTREIIIQGRTAIIPVMGVISKHMGLFTQISGGTSTETLQKDLQAAIDNKDVDSINLKIDSPGGAVPGIFELSDFIYQSRGKKPIIAYADGMAASAAYLIASAADEIIAYSTSEVGGIGIVTIHTDVSEADKQAGIKRTVLTSGKYKAAGNPYGPLDKDAQDYRQAQLDYFYGLFVEAVARNRGITTKKVLTMADGRIFIGQQALDVGLVDKLGNFDFALGRAQKRRKKMDLAILKAEHPNLVDALHNEGQEQGQKTGYAEGLKAGQKTGYDDGFKAGVEAEKSRESEIRECTPLGMEHIAGELIAKGISVAEAMKAMLQATKAEAVAKLEADKKVKADKLDQLHLESPDAVDPLKKKNNANTDLSNLPPEERAKKEWESSPQLQAEFNGMGGQKSYIAFVVNQEKGLIRGKFQ